MLAANDVLTTVLSRPAQALTFSCEKQKQRLKRSLKLSFFFFFLIHHSKARRGEKKKREQARSCFLCGSLEVTDFQLPCWPFLDLWILF